MRALAPVAVAASLLLVTATSALAGDDYRTFTPDGPGPHPAVLFVSGCSGFAPSMAPKVYERIAGQLRGQGFLVAFVDYLGVRRLASCARGAVTHEEAAGDLVKAAAWARARPDVDPARVTALGWSFGGGVVLTALHEYEEDKRGFTRAIVYYPSCATAGGWKGTTPLLMLLGGADTVARGEACQESVQKSLHPEAVKQIVYPGAYHAFDVEELPAKTQYAFGTIGYQPEAARAAWREVEQFLGPARK